MVKKDWMKTDEGIFIPNMKKWTVTKPAILRYMNEEKEIKIQYPILRASKQVYAEDYKVVPCTRDDVIEYLVELEWHPKALYQCPYCKKGVMTDGSFNLYKKTFHISHLLGHLELGSRLKSVMYDCEHKFSIDIPYEGTVKKLFIMNKQKRQWERIKEEAITPPL